MPAKTEHAEVGRRCGPAPRGLRAWVSAEHFELEQRQALPGELALLAAQTGAILGVEGEVRVALVGDARMSALHERHLGDNTTTDVLTFAEPMSADGQIDADVYLCVDEARRQASARGHSLSAELSLYLVHAILHALGWDDAEPEQAEQMHAKEDEILRAMGLGSVYRSGAGGSGGTGGGVGADACMAPDRTCDLGFGPGPSSDLDSGSGMSDDAGGVGR